MLSPLAIAGGLVVDSGEEFEVLNGDLLGLDTQLVVELSLRGALYTQYRSIKLCASLTGDAKRVGAASVGPHIGERDFLGGTLLEQQALIRVEQEYGEGTVEETLVNVGHQVAYRGKMYKLALVRVRYH